MVTLSAPEPTPSTPTCAGSVDVTAEQLVVAAEPPVTTSFMSTSSAFVDAVAADGGGPVEAAADEVEEEAVGDSFPRCAAASLAAEHRTQSEKGQEWNSNRARKRRTQCRVAETKSD